ncbi:hypothetical protein K469DRAFT_734024 [Zopfia rhizophila CBS 207.26]|uniref:Involucrin repeat protein n=1 Tax=Zopfia rhizophila CBS 207.26 TaxID=1314779 RepID=A0A6A6EZ12_9PEZI|nr:hypothetical protein K469DRAFT_734024 [Zopfia rhizophila CBS 207.26]
MSGGMATREEHRGPITKLVDWWKDHEDVQRMEEYTEYIGVCRGCFDPRSSVMDAPRKHHYNRKRSGEFRPSGIEKQSRYYTSDGESKRKGNKAGWLATGLAAYGLTKAGKALWNPNSNNFDDTYSIKSGREARSRTSLHNRSRSRSRDRKYPSGTSETRYRSRSRDRMSRMSTGVIGERKDYKIVRHRSRSRSRSHSRDRKSGLLGAAIGASIAASAAGHSRRKHRSRSRSTSPQKVFVHRRRDSSDHDRRRSKSHRSGHRSSRSSIASSSYVDISQTHRPQGSRILGGFFSASPPKEKRRKTHPHSKKKKGFFNFGNASSSSSDSVLAFGAGYDRRRRRSGRRSSDEKLNATLVGLGATAAAIAATRAGRSKHSKHRPEAVAVREHKHKRKSGDRHRSTRSSRSSSDNEDGWESLPEDDSSDSSSLSSGLAFGDYDWKKGKSQESLASSASGTSKWGWRWRSEKKKKRPSVESLHNAGASAPFVGPAVAGAVAGAAIGRQDSSASSVPTLQSVYAVPTTDPNRYDAITRTGSIPPPQPLVTARPDGINIQQPQPMHQVPGAIYSTQAPPQPTYSAPSGLPVFSNVPTQPSYSSQFQSGIVESPKQTSAPPLSRRGNSSPTLSSWKRDAAIAGVAAGVGAAAVAASKSGTRRASSPTNVRFELTKEQAKKEERERRREQDRQDEEDRRRRREKQYQEEEARRVEEDRRRREKQRRDEDAERLARLEAEQREADRRREPAERRARETRESEEAERRAREARIEAQRKEDLEREADRMRIERREAERREAEIREDSERRRREREAQAAYGRQDRVYESDHNRRERKLEEQRTGSSVNSDVRRKEKELEERERDIVQPEAWKTTAAAATVAGAAAAITSAAISSHRDQAPVKHIEPSKVAQDYADDDIFDPNLFKKSRSDPVRESEIARTTASRFLQDWEERYSQAPVSQADFFAPRELLDHSGAQSPRIDPNEGADIHVYQAHDYDLSAPKVPPYPPTYSFTATKDGRRSSSVSSLYPVPTLNLIQPTPPGSRANSIKGVSLPPSPVIEPKDEPKKEESMQDPTTRGGSRVSWGVNQTHNYEVQTPESYRESWISDRDSKVAGPEHSQDEIVVEVESPESGTKRTSYRPEKSEPSQPVASEIPASTQYVPEADTSVYNVVPSKKQNKKDKKKAKAAAAAAAAAATAAAAFSWDEKPDTNSHTTEDDPTSGSRSAKVQSKIPLTSSVYQAPFYESISDVSAVPPSQPRHGFVEGEITEESEPITKVHIPGSFDDEPEGETSAKDEWADVSTKKGKGKKSKSTDEDVSMQDVPKPTGEKSTPEPVEVKEMPPEPQRKLSKKEKRKAKQAKRASSDTWEDAETSQPDTPQIERDIRDIQPTTHSYSELPKTIEKTYDGGVDLGASKSGGDSSSVAKAVVAGGLAGLVAAAMKQDQDKTASELESAKKSFESADKYAPPVEYVSSTSNGTRALGDIGKAVSIPSTAFHDGDELAEAKTPKQKEKRHSGKFTPPVGSPLRTELQYDYVGPKVERSVPKDELFSDVPKAPSEARSYEPEDLTSHPVHDSGYYAPDDQERNDVADRDSREEFYSADSDDKMSTSKRRDSEKYNDHGSRSVTSESRYDDDVDRKARHRRRESERSESRDRGYEFDGERKKRHHRRRESERSDDWDSRSVVSEVRSEANGERRRKHKRRESERNGSPEDRVRSSAASEPGDIYERERKSKRRSKRDSDFDDTASVVSSPARYDEERSSKKDKEKRSSGIFGLFGGSKSKESLIETSSKSSKSRDSRREDEFEDVDRKHRKKKHRGSTYGSDDDDDDARSTVSSRDRREKRRSRTGSKDDTGMDIHHHAISKDRDSRGERMRDSRYTADEDQSFLGNRAVAATPLPVSEAASLDISRSPQPHEESGIPGDRPEFPLPTLDNFHPFALDQSKDVERPTTPIEDSRALLTRLTGLPSWQLEAFPDELPPLPHSRPSSPLVQSPEQTHSPISALRGTSSTSIPLRFRRPAPSPGLQRDLTLDLASASSPASSPLQPPRPRHVKSSSTEFKGVREYRPLYLVERNRKSSEIEEALPALPSSGGTSRTPSERGTEDEYQSALESPHMSASETFEDPFTDPFGVVSTQQQVEQADGDGNVPESQQTTPKASSFPPDVLKLSEDTADSTRGAIPTAPEESKGLGLSFEESSLQQTSSRPLSPLEKTDAQAPDIEAPQSRKLSPHKSSSALHDAAVGALTGSATAAILTHESTSTGYDSDFMGGEPDQADIDLAAQSIPPPEPQEPARPSILRMTSSSSKKGKKGPKGMSIEFTNEQSKELTAEDRQKIREKDTADAVEGWFEDPVEEPTPIEPKTPEPIKESVAPDPTLLKRDNKGKGKKKKGKTKKGSISATPDSPLPTQTEEQPDSLPTTSQSAPQFVLHEEDWKANRAESVITDDATLVGESTFSQYAGSPETSSKEFRRQKVLDSTAPNEEEDLRARNVTVEPGQPELGHKTSLQDLLGPALTRKISESKLKSIEPSEHTGPSVDLWAATTPKLEREALVEPGVLEAALSGKGEAEASVPTLEAAFEHQPEGVTSQIVPEEEFGAVRKGRKGKKGKKNRKGSSQVELFASLPEDILVTKDEGVAKASTEELQSEIEHEILKPALAEHKKDSTSLEAPIPTDSTESILPTDIHERSKTLEENQEFADGIQSAKELVSEAGPIGTVSTEVQEEPVQDVELITTTLLEPKPDIQKEVQIEEPAPSLSIAQSLWGALGWGKKKSTSPEPKSLIPEAIPKKTQEPAAKSSILAQPKEVVERLAIAGMPSEILPLDEPLSMPAEVKESPHLEQQYALPQLDFDAKQSDAIPEDSSKAIEASTQVTDNKTVDAPAEVVQAVQPEIRAEDEWATPKKKKGKKGKGKGPALDDVSSEPIPVELGEAKLHDFVEDCSALGEAADDQEPKTQTEVEETPPAKPETQPEGDYWGFDTKKKGKKDKKKGKRASIQPSEPAELELEPGTRAIGAADTKPELEAIQSILEQSKNDGTSQILPEGGQEIPPEPEPQPKDEWDLPSKRKGKNEKERGRRETMQPSTPLEPEPSMQGIVLTETEPTLDTTSTPLDKEPSEETVPIPPRLGQEPLTEAQLALQESQWPLTPKKKGKKGKGKKVTRDIGPSEPESSTQSDIVTPVQELEQTPEPVQTEPSIQEIFSVENEPSREIIELPKDQVAEDEWAALTSKKDKKKKGKGKKAVQEVELSTLIEAEPSSQQDIIAPDKEPEQLSQSIDPEPSIQHDVAAVETPLQQEITEVPKQVQDEWAMPVSKKDKKKKGREKKALQEAEPSEPTAPESIQDVLAVEEKSELAPLEQPEETAADDIWEAPLSKKEKIKKDKGKKATLESEAPEPLATPSEEREAPSLENQTVPEAQPSPEEHALSKAEEGTLPEDHVVSITEAFPEAEIPAETEPILSTTTPEPPVGVQPDTQAQPQDELDEWAPLSKKDKKGKKAKKTTQQVGTPEPIATPVEKSKELVSDDLRLPESQVEEISNVQKQQQDGVDDWALLSKKDRKEAKKRKRSALQSGPQMPESLATPSEEVKEANFVEPVLSETQVGQASEVQEQQQDNVEEWARISKKEKKKAKKAKKDTLPEGETPETIGTPSEELKEAVLEKPLDLGLKEESEQHVEPVPLMTSSEERTKPLFEDQAESGSQEFQQDEPVIITPTLDVTPLETQPATRDQELQPSGEDFGKDISQSSMVLPVEADRSLHVLTPDVQTEKALEETIVVEEIPADNVQLITTPIEAQDTTADGWDLSTSKKGRKGKKGKSKQSITGEPVPDALPSEPRPESVPESHLAEESVENRIDAPSTLLTAESKETPADEWDFSTTKKGKKGKKGKDKQSSIQDPLPDVVPSESQPEPTSDALLVHETPSTAAEVSTAVSLDDPEEAKADELDLSSSKKKRGKKRGAKEVTTETPPSDVVPEVSFEGTQEINPTESKALGDTQLVSALSTEPEEAIVDDRGFSTKKTKKGKKGKGKHSATETPSPEVIREFEAESALQQEQQVGRAENGEVQPASEPSAEPEEATVEDWGLLTPKKKGKVGKGKKFTSRSSAPETAETIIAPSHDNLDIPSEQPSIDVEKALEPAETGKSERMQEVVEPERAAVVEDVSRPTITRKLSKKEKKAKKKAASQSWDDAEPDLKSAGQELVAADKAPEIPVGEAQLVFERSQDEPPATLDIETTRKTESFPQADATSLEQPLEKPQELLEREAAILKETSNERDMFADGQDLIISVPEQGSGRGPGDELPKEVSPEDQWSFSASKKDKRGKKAKKAQKKPASLDWADDVDSPPAQTEVLREEITAQVPDVTQVVPEQAPTSTVQEVKEIGGLAADVPHPDEPREILEDSLSNISQHVQESFADQPNVPGITPALVDESLLSPQVENVDLPLVPTEDVREDIQETCEALKADDFWAPISRKASKKGKKGKKNQEEWSKSPNLGDNQDRFTRVESETQTTDAATKPSSEVVSDMTATDDAQKDEQDDWTSTSKKSKREKKKGKKSKSTSGAATSIAGNGPEVLEQLPQGEADRETLSTKASEDPVIKRVSGNLNVSKDGVALTQENLTSAQEPQLGDVDSEVPPPATSQDAGVQKTALSVEPSTEMPSQQLTLGVEQDQSQMEPPVDLPSIHATNIIESVQDALATPEQIEECEQEPPQEDTSPFSLSRSSSTKKKGKKGKKARKDVWQGMESEPQSSAEPIVEVPSATIEERGLEIVGSQPEPETLPTLARDMDTEQDGPAFPPGSPVLSSVPEPTLPANGSLNQVHPQGDGIAAQDGQTRFNLGSAVTSGPEPLPVDLPCDQDIFLHGHVEDQTSLEQVQPTEKPEQQGDLQAAELSPSLKVLQDDLANFSKRSEALDQALQSEDKIEGRSLDKPSVSQSSSSLADVVEKLSKKDKKKGKKGKGAAFDWSESTTPSAEPETIPDVQEPIKLEEPKLEEPKLEEPMPVDALTRKLSKKEKKKAKATTFSWDEPTEEPTSAPDVQESSKVEPTSLDASAKLSESQDISQAESSGFAIPTRKLSKKEKKKAAKAAAFDWVDSPAPESEPTPLPVTRDHVGETETSLPESQQAVEENTEPKSVADPQDTVKEESPALSRKQSKKDKKKAKAAALAWDEPTSEHHEPAPLLQGQDTWKEEPDPASIPNAQEDILEQTPVLSRKLSKKDKKKAKQTALAWDEPTVSSSEATLPTEGHDIGQEEHQPATVPESHEVVMDEPGTAPTTETQEIPQEEANSLAPARKLSKKEKKKAKVAALTWHEPAAVSSEPSRSAETQELVTEEQLDFTDAQEALKETEQIVKDAEEVMMDVDPVLADARQPLREQEPSSTDTQILATQEEPASTDVQESVRVDEQHVAEVPDAHMEEEPTVAPTLTRKLSKKEKKKDKAAALDWPEPTQISGQSAPVRETQASLPAEPTTDDFAPQLSKKDKKKARKGVTSAFHWTAVEEPESAEQPKVIEPSVPESEISKDNVTDVISVQATPEPEALPIDQQFLGTIDRGVSFNGAVAPLDSTPQGETATILDGRPAPQPEAKPEFEFTSKRSKKEKRKSKKSSTAFEGSGEPSESSPPKVDVVEPALEPSSSALDTQDNIVEKEIPPASIEPEAPMPTVEADEFAPSTKKSKKKERESQKASAESDEPVEVAELVAVKGNLEGMVQDVAISTPSADIYHHIEKEAPLLIPPVEPEMQSTPVEIAEPTFATKTPKKEKRKAKKHKFAAFFEPDTPAEEEIERQIPSQDRVRKELASAATDTTESVLQSIEPSGAEIERQIVTEAIDLGDGSKYEVRDEIGKYSVLDQRAQSPDKDIDFAATLAAGLKESGFDPDLVLKDASFHQSTSPPRVQDDSPEEDVAAARSEAGKSRYRKLGRASPTPTSPKSQPATEAQNISHTEVAVTLQGTPSFNPIDILNDPVFSQQKSLPGALEEADPEELWTSSKESKKGKGKKKRASASDTPIENEERGIDYASGAKHLETVTVDGKAAKDEQIFRSAASLEPTSHGLQSHNEPEEQAQRDQATVVTADSSQATPLEEEPEAFWSTTSKKKSKKASKKEKRASLAQNKSESPAVEVPVIEAPTAVPFAVETPAVDASISKAAREIEDEKPSQDSTFESRARTLPSQEEVAPESLADKSPFDVASAANANLHNDLVQLTSQEAESSLPRGDLGKPLEEHIPRITVEPEAVNEPTAADNIWKDQPKNKSKKGKGKLKRSSTVEQSFEPETSSAPIPSVQDDSEIPKNVVEEKMVQPEQSFEQDGWGTSKKKGKNSKKDRAGTTALLAAGATILDSTALDKYDTVQDERGERSRDIEEPSVLESPIVEESKSSRQAESGEYPFPKITESEGSRPTGTEEAKVASEDNVEDVNSIDEWALPLKKKGKKGKKNSKGKVESQVESESWDLKDLSMAPSAEQGKALETVTGLGIPEAQSKEEIGGEDKVTEVSHVAIHKPLADIHDPSLKEQLSEPSESKDAEESSRSISEKASQQSQSPQRKLSGVFADVERVKRRVPPVSMPEAQPEEKRVHLSEQVSNIREGPLESSTFKHESAAYPPDPITQIHTVPDVEDSRPIANVSGRDADTLPTSASSRSPAIQPTWSFGGVRDSAVHMADTVLLSTAPQFSTNNRDSGYHDAGYSPSMLQGPNEPPEGSHPSRAKETRNKPTADRNIHNDHSRALQDLTDQAYEENYAAQPRSRSPSLPEPGSFSSIPSPSAVDSATKERTSYLFNSSPSTRGHIESPSISSKSRQQEAAPTSAPVQHSKDVSKDVKDSPARYQKEVKEHPSPHKTKESRSRAHSSPTRQEKRNEPYQSIFGDPSEREVEKPATYSTPVRHIRSPSAQLDTIKEYSPDDSPLHKKGRAITDVGAPERGVKSARRTENPKLLHERLKSPPPQTPTPVGRKHSNPKMDTSTRDVQSKDSPWHQVHESVDRTMNLSPAQRPGHAQRSPPFTTEPTKQRMGEQRSPSVLSDRSTGGITRYKTPDHLRPLSAASNRSATPPLRRVDRSTSGDLRAAARLGEAKTRDAKKAQLDIALTVGATAAIAGIASSSTYDPVRDKGKGRAVDMPDVYEAWGEAQGSPMSPTRPPSVRKRQSMQIMDLQTQLEQLAAQNRSLEEAKAKAEESMQAAHYQRQVDSQVITEAVEARDREIHQKDIDIAQLRDTLRTLQAEVTRLTELNNTLTEANRNITDDTNERYAQLQAEGSQVHQQWQESSKALEELRAQHTQLTTGMEDVVRAEIALAMDDRNAEIKRLNAELVTATEQIKTLQRLTSKQGDSFLVVRDEDYFDSACQQLCQHVQQWVLRFSKFSDTRACRLSSEVASDHKIDHATREKIETRLDNAILDGSDVDMLLADRVKRRDVFMSVVMTMIWEYVFTRYLFGMDREQRQKLKSLEKTLSEVGPTRAVAQWRAITLTLLSKRDAFVQQRAQDTEAVVHEIYSTLSTLLPPPSHLQKQIQESLRNVMRLAVELSIEMRTQRAEYIMLPPLQPEYDTNGDLVAKVTFNASLMNERSGETTSNDELEARGAVIKIVLFPLVVKKGDDFGEGEDEIVVCPAQVLVARATNKKVVRVMSGAMDIDSRGGRSVTSLVPESSIMDISGSNVI